VSHWQLLYVNSSKNDLFLKENHPLPPSKNKTKTTTFCVINQVLYHVTALIKKQFTCNIILCVSNSIPFEIYLPEISIRTTEGDALLTEMCYMALFVLGTDLLRHG
jgi:hypothetical protein